jgi:hypothetical protein
MTMPSLRWMMCGAAAFAAFAYVATPAPAQAQFGISLPGGFGINLHGGGYRSRWGHRRHRVRGPRERGPREAAREESRGEEMRRGRPEKVVASEGAPSSAEQTRALLRIAKNIATVSVSSAKDINEVGQQSLTTDKARDYTVRIKDIIERFKGEQYRSRDATPGDVTALAIEQSLEKAVKNAKLDVFERFLNERWTPERLRTMILDRVYADLGSLFDGNNRGNAPMEALDTLIQRASDSVFRRIFETSELLAANKSSALFMQRLYQTHGAQVDGELRETADRMITRASMGAVGRYETAMKRDVNGYALRYRAQRIVFDCLSEHVEKITSSETGILTNGEIQQKIANTSSAVCGAWLENQFGSEKADLKPQRPMPVRVIWGPDGPKDDPSMYGTGNRTF